MRVPITLWRSVPSGIVQVTSTGKVGKTTRSLQVGVGRGGSTDFLYYTDEQDADPNNAQAYGQNPEFYAFYRSLAAYRETFKSGDVIVLDPKSEFLRYFGEPEAKGK